MTARDHGPSYDVFEPSAYLERYYSNDGNSYNLSRMKHSLRCYHETFDKLPNGLKVLDYGCGPSIFPAISAARKATEIVLSDFSEKNCKIIRSWLNGDPRAHDWSPRIKFVVSELEGKTDKAAEERQGQIRKLVKTVVHCDITRDPPIDSDYNYDYDVVISSLVLESAARNLSEYETYAARLGTLVKPGGLLLLYCIENKTGFYEVGDLKFDQLIVTAEFTTTTLKKAGFVDVAVDKFYADDPNRIFSFIKGTRGK